ncbi:AAA family ATPase [Streptomyces sp. NPDC003077]|uniref:AAA family ATPase n=1 Tax=Streptomyces sp. NPDC003077 TaxID=3154443 RepID=UPI0033A8FA5C
MDEHAGDLGAVGRPNPGPGPDPALGPGEPIVGRDAELARLFRAVDAVGAVDAVDLVSDDLVSTDPVVTLVGDMGTGKSALLDRAVRRAEVGGAHVLRAAGSESESSLPFSALHQLLRPVSAEVDGLPERQRAALRDAFGAEPATSRRSSATACMEPAMPRRSSASPRMLIGVAVLGLLSALGERRPVLVVLDDAQWCDRASLEALSFAARRLEGERVTMLIAARGADLLLEFDRHAPTLTLGPLDNAAANRLLDLRPKSPTGHLRTRILDEALGNPLALVELTRAATAHDAAVPLPSAGPLPVTDHLERAFAARLNDLPAATTRALLLLSAMEPVDSALAVSAGLLRAEGEGRPWAGDDGWPRAEEAEGRSRAGEGAGPPTEQGTRRYAGQDARLPVRGGAWSRPAQDAARPRAEEDDRPPAGNGTRLRPADDGTWPPTGDDTQSPTKDGIRPSTGDDTQSPTKDDIWPFTKDEVWSPTKDDGWPSTKDAVWPLTNEDGWPSTKDDIWLPAEQAALIRRTGPDLRFRHPLVRSAVYHAAPLGARREAHLALAELLRDEPDRRAWHLAAACPGPDAAVSAELERTAGRARRRGGHAAAAKALQRAAELAPRREESARLLVEAASAAVFTGDLAWVEELAAAARARTDDPSLLADVAVQAGRLAILTAHHTAVFSRLTEDAEELAASRPAAALDLLAGAAVVRFYSGEDPQRHRIRDLLRRLPEDASSVGLRTWVRTVSDPITDRAALVPLLPRLAAEAATRPEHLTTVGIMAWLLDETPQAVRAFDAAFDRWELRGTLPEGLGGAVAWAYVERGRWERARAACARTTAVGRATGLDHAVACAATVDATVLAYQGHTASARARVEAALALIDPLESRSVAVYARRALGAAAAADGAYETAYDHLRMIFTAEGAPVHYHASYPSLAELAAAAVRCGRREDAAAIVERSARTLAEGASPRLRALLARARGLLADPEDAEPHFRAALADPALAHWPFERAQTLLDLAEWLRRRRRIAEARGPLAEALETFRRLGAHPWTERAEAESRAAGLGVTDPSPDAIAQLSPQQRQIVSLAARGLTNREIGEKLYLSPRTVGSHLYRSFPKLGITARSQLRDLVEGTVTTADGRESTADGGEPTADGGGLSSDRQK